MKEKITLKVVRDLTKVCCHLVVPVKLLIPEEILYDVVRVYQYGIMTFNTSKVFDSEFVDRLLKRSVRDWSSSRKEELMRFLIVTYKYMQDPCPGQTIADLGCGMNRLKGLVKNYKAWYSFDHCAVDPSVVEADCSDLHEYLGDESIDSAVFCMSLWGTNYLDSIKEVHRYLKTGGTLYVVEPKEKVDQSVLLGEVVQLGFNLTNLVLERNGKTYFEYKKVR